jgi:hypothetical protein
MTTTIAAAAARLRHWWARYVQREVPRASGGTTAGRRCGPLNRESADPAPVPIFPSSGVGAFRASISAPGDYRRAHAAKNDVPGGSGSRDRRHQDPQSSESRPKAKHYDLKTADAKGPQSHRASGTEHRASDLWPQMR